jgi:S1/P1 Nuclease
MSFLLISWGRVGHEAIGYIAASHLTPKTAAAIKSLLGNETLADISNYADEIRSDSFFQFTGPWHYLDVPAEENHAQFKESVSSLTTPNIYTALLHWESVLADTRSNRSVKIFALKMVVHLVGDAHQPLHIARTVDEGGNLVPLWFDNQSTNLHALWDSKMIERRGLTAQELAADWDFANPEDIKNWQADSLLGWLYESNHISNHIYDEHPEGKRLGKDYYDQHIELVRQRIDQAGIRLAGILNQCFDPPKIAPLSDTTICDKIYDGKFLESSQITFLNLGGAYPNQKISIVIKGADRDKFKEAPEKLYMGKTICVKGVIELYKGRLEIVVTDPNQIIVR